jgi:DNA-binding CsgD family transcriptional regulator
MHVPEDLSALIGDIYDAALDPGLWVSVLEKTSHFVGGCAASLHSKDAIAKSAHLYYDYGIEAPYRHLYFSKYVKYDPGTMAQFFADVGQTVATEDIMPYDEFLETRFYQEWAQPQGLVDCANTVLEKSSTSTAMFCVIRHERDGVVDGEARRRAQLIVPHIRRAVLVGKLINIKESQAASLAGTLDGLSAGMFLLAPSGSILHANSGGQIMLASGEVLCAPGTRVVATDPNSDHALQEALAAALKGDSAVGSRGVSQALLARPSGERYVAHVMPLTSGARRHAAKPYAAAAVLFVHKIAFQTPSAPEVIAKTFKLTPTELRILLSIVQVGGVPETAEALGITENTVKTHLRRLFEKTGASRQVDLVKLVAGFSHSLAH